MTRKELGILVFKVAGLYLWLQAALVIIQILGYYPMTVTFFGNNSGHPVYQFMLLTIQLVAQLLLVGGGWFLVTRSESLALMLFGAQNSDALVSRVSLADALTAAYSVAGIYLCSLAIPKIFTGLWNYFAIDRKIITNMRPMRVSDNGLIVGVIQLGLGLFLFFGSRGLVSLWRRIRQL